MPINNQSLNKELYKLLKVRGFDPIPKDSTGETSPVPDEADVFKFTFKQDGNSLGTAWATIDGNNKLTVYYGDDITKNVSENEDPNNTFDLSWTGFLKHLKMWAQRRQMGFDLENKDHLHSDMAQRDHAKKQEVAESNIKLMKKGITMPNISEGYYPMGKSASYNDNIPTVKIILQHTRQIQEGEQRYRNIARIFLENAQGERFLAPTNKPGIAQIYARHLAEGGNVNDERWNHIKSLCEEYGKMSGFVRAVRGNQFNESAQRLVEAGLNHYQSLRESLSRMRGHRGYNSYFENWTPTLMENEGDETTINELFVQETLDPRIESVMPILSKLSKTVSEMKEVKELDEWADSLIESPDDEVNAHNESSDEKNMKRKELEEVTDAEKADIKIKVPAYRRDKVTTSDLEKAKEKNISGPEGLKALNTKVDSNVKEGLGPEQKRVGQLGPTEKVKKNSGARGKLVGANESVEQGVAEGFGDVIKGIKRKVAGKEDTVKFEVDSENAYNHVMNQFGSVVEWDGDTMVAPRKYWGSIQELSYSAGGEATEVGNEQGVAEGLAQEWEVSFDYGPHESERLTVKADSKEEAIAKVKEQAKKSPMFKNISINWAKPVKQGVAEGDQLDEMNPMLVRDGLQVVIDFLSQYPTATTLTAGVAGAAAGTAIIAKLVKNAWKNHKELEQLKQDVINWSSQKLHANKNVAAKGGKVAKIIQAEIARRKKDVAEGSINDYFKRRKDEEDRIAGTKAPAKRTPQQTDYAKRRAQEKKDEQGVAEGQEDLEEATSMKQQWKNDVKQVHGNNVRFEVNKAVRSNEETQSEAYDENGNKVAYFYHKSGRQNILPKPKVNEDLSKTDIKKQISKFEELALAANRAGDDEKSKQYQRKIQSLKQKMSQDVKEGQEDLDALKKLMGK
jgi:hypothetical protein